MSLIDKLKNLWDSDNAKLTRIYFEPDHVDRPLAATTIQAGRHYFRLRLAEMFLKKRVQGARTWYPAVHSLVQLNFGSQEAPVQIPNIADTTRVGTQEINEGDVIARNFVLTPTLPFSGGIVTLDAGLVAVQGQNYLNNFMGVLSHFANLLAVPQLSTALTLAQPLANGIQELFGAGQGRLHLGLRESYAADEMKEGYIAAIRAPDDEVDISRLWIVKDQLRKGSGLQEGQHTAYTDFDHMLFRVELFENRDDWDKLTAIDEPFQEAIKHLGEGNDDKAVYFLRRALLRVQQAPELTQAHRRIVSDELKSRFKNAQEQFGFEGLVGEDLTLAQVMKHPGLSIAAALAKGEPTLDEIFDLGEP